MGLLARMPRSLVTDRLLLRPWAVSDAPAYRRLWSERDPRSLRLIGPDGRPTVADLRQEIRDQLAKRVESGIGLMAVERRDQSTFIGYCGLIERAATPSEPELAFELLRAAHGNGYATEAARAVRDAAREAGQPRLWAEVREWNTASRRVLSKIGFVPSGEVHPDSERGNAIVMTCVLVSATDGG